MKHLITFILFIGFTQFGFSQSACDNSNSIQGKTESELTDIKRLKIYWSKRCACESGQITGGDWEYTVKLVNDNYDMYHERRNKFPSEYSYNGSLVPDRKISVNECNSDNSLHINDSGTTNCGKKAFDANKDPQNYGNDFMRARCQCLEGVPFEEDAKKLEATMKINFQNAQTYYGNTLGMQPLAWTECPIIQFGGIQSNESTQTPAPTLIYTGHESDIDKLKDDYLKTFTTSGTFNAYVSGENIKRVGIAMAMDFSSNLEKITSLSSTVDPKQLLAEFNERILQIENMESTFNKENNSYSFQAGKDIGNSIMSENYEATLHQLGGLLNASLEAREAREMAEYKKAKLYAERSNRMNNIYWKAIDYNEDKIDQFNKLAAFAASEGEEQYYLEYIENLDCFKNSMSVNFSVSNTSWLNNNCPTPTKANFSRLSNNFVEQHVQKAKLADKKYSKYKENGIKHYRDAAILYISDAINEKKEAKYFIQLASYYEGYSNVMALINILTAKQIKPSSENNKNDLSQIEKLKGLVEFEIEQAIINNDIDYLNTFLELELDKIIHIKSNDLLTFSLLTDQPDAVQLILNKRIEGKSKTESQKNLQELIILCALNNSSKSIERMIDLGLSIDFNVKGKHPIDIAESVLAVDAYKVLLNETSSKSEFEKKFINSPINILITAETRPSEAGSQLESIKDNKSFPMLVDQLINGFNKKSQYIETVGNSAMARAYISSNEKANTAAKQKFIEDLTKPYVLTHLDLYFKHNIFNFASTPTLFDFGIKDQYFVHVSEIKKGQSHTVTKGPRQTQIVTNQITGKRIAITSNSSLRLNKNAGYYIGNKSIELNPNTSLAVVAFELRNPLLFHALDERYDMSMVKANGSISLFQYMLESKSFTNIIGFYNYRYFQMYLEFHANGHRKNINDYVKSSGYETNNWEQPLLNYWEGEMNFLLNYEKDRKYFYSMDFDFKEKVGANYPIFTYLTKETPSMHGFNYRYVKAIESHEILSKYEFNKDQLNTDGSGSILHWYLKQAEGSNITFLFPTIEFIKSLEINKELKNNEGQTIQDYFKENKKNFYKYGSSQRIAPKQSKYKDIMYYEFVYGTNETNLPIREYVSRIIK